jgi:hypothetical protein
VTVTAKIYSAATSSSEAELARQCLVTQRFHTDTVPPFDVTDCPTKLEHVLVLSLGAHVAQEIWRQLVKPALHSKMLETSLSATRVVTVPGDPAQSIHRFVLADNHATDPTPMSLAFDSLFGKPKADPLEGYEQYSQANWDGHSAESITAETLQYARWLLKAIPETFGPPDIAPSGDGSIGLEWVPESGSLHKLFLDIGPGPEWRAYWNRRNGEFGRMPGRGFSLITKPKLQKLFNDLSR